MNAPNEADHEETPFLPRLSDGAAAGGDATDSGVLTLLLQHASNAWGNRMAEFAMHLYLITYYEDTLLPNALYGFSSCVVNIVFAQWLGSLVDKTSKLKLVRRCVATQKLSAFTAYATFVAMFYSKYSVKPTEVPETPPLLSWPALGMIVLAGSVLQASNTCITIAVERDWVTCIADGDSERLSLLNAKMKRIDLSCKLLAPLFVSVLSTFMSYLWASVAMSALTLGAFAVELLWLGVVYRSCPALARDQARKDSRVQAEQDRVDEQEREACMPDLSSCSPVQSKGYWVEFSRLPTFLSSLSSAFLYMTVLSFDGTMLSYLKTQGYSDGTLSVLRGVNVITGLGGTVLAPWLERRIGSVRSGSWTIWSEVVCLIPVILALQFSTNQKELGVAVLLFGGMAFSRIGLWSFDLIQVKQLQVSLEAHPERNTLTSLQFSLQNTADLTKYILTMVFYRPSEFKWTALLSFISVLSGAATYSLYVKRERGHLFHFGSLVKERVWHR